jgi:CBS domain containing-hemolysin-like protein
MGASAALVFVSSLARREPIRLPSRFAGDREDDMMPVIHRSLVVHIGLGLSCAIAALAATTLPSWVFLPYLGAVVIARVLGERIGKVHPRFARVLAPLLGPVDGAALLIDWMVSPLLRRNGAGAQMQEVGETPYDQVLELTQRTVEQVMTPRSEVDWFRSDATLSEITQTLRSRPHAYYPVFEGDFEHVVGMVSLIDLFRSVSPEVTAAALARPAVMVPETMSCDDLLERMRRDRFDTAVVLDEFGGIAGLIALEDLLEVLVGEMIGEHEPVRVRARRMADGSYLVDAAVRIEEFEDLFNVTLPEGDYETLAGLFLSHVVRIPSPGEKLQVESLRLEVAEADAHRIRTIKVAFADAVPPASSRQQTR